MQKILSAAQIREADQFTIRQEKIESIELMERASKAFVNEFLNHVQVDRTIAVVCGPGNNGGDGLAIARLLLERGFKVSCYLLDLGSELSQDCRINLNRLEKLIEVSRIDTSQTLSLTGEIVIDAIFGSGLNRAVSGLVAEVINLINTSDSSVVSVDIPSGLMSEEMLETTAIIEADLTISFQLP